MDLNRFPLLIQTDTFSFSVVWCGVGLGRRHIGPPGLSQSRVSLRSNGMREWKAVNQRRTRRRCIYNERRGQRGGLGWKAPDACLWLLIDQ
uniref:Uncharacterized protein n=1 Tax=Mesocestoides corti TaxID=53468 RepID=A0A5K3G304_MESCO